MDADQHRLKQKEKHDVHNSAEWDPKIIRVNLRPSVVHPLSKSVVAALDTKKIGASAGYLDGTLQGCLEMVITE